MSAFGVGMPWTFDWASDAAGNRSEATNATAAAQFLVLMNNSLSPSKQ